MTRVGQDNLSSCTLTRREVRLIWPQKLSLVFPHTDKVFSFSFVVNLTSSSIHALKSQKNVRSLQFILIQILSLSLLVWAQDLLFFLFFCLYECMKIGNTNISLINPFLKQMYTTYCFNVTSHFEGHRKMSPSAGVMHILQSQWPYLWSTKSVPKAGNWFFSPDIVV